MSAHVPITDAMLASFWDLVPSVVDRYRRDGRADRRETAALTLLAGLVPMVGLLVLGWAPGTVIACTLVNLALLLVDDLFKAALATGAWRTLAEQAAEDDYVWRIGAALLRGRTRVPQELDGGVRRIRVPVWLLWPLSLGSLGLAAFNVLLTTGPGATIPVQDVAWGSLPNLVLVFASYAVGALARNPHWRRAGSTRHGSAAGSAYGLFMLGMLALPLILAPGMPDPDRLADGSVALLVAAGATGFGAWRWHALAQRDAVAKWLGAGSRRARRRGTLRG
jgi:hypothetical protein